MKDFSVGDQDSASAPTTHPHSPCPYIWFFDIWCARLKERINP